jgi:hypothetical protein
MFTKTMFALFTALIVGTKVLILGSGHNDFKLEIPQEMPL